LQRKFEETATHLGRERRQLETWRCQAEEEQAALYAALLAAPVGQREIERTLGKVDGLRQRTRALERGVESAREARDQALESLRQGRAVRAAAARATRKSVEVLDAYRRERAMARNRSAEEALDEIAVMLHGRNSI
jgi:hypothetical protein